MTPKRDELLERTPQPCLNCGEPQEFTEPFVHGEFVGYMSNHTKCGDEYRQFTFTYKDKSKGLRVFDELMEACLNERK